MITCSTFDMFDLTTSASILKLTCSICLLNLHNRDFNKNLFSLLNFADSAGCKIQNKAMKTFIHLKVCHRHDTDR